MNTSFKAYLFGPGLGDEAVEGTISVDRSAVRFVSESVSEKISAADLQIEVERGGRRIFFNDARRPEVSIYTFEKSILKDWARAPAESVRMQCRSLAGRMELKWALRVTLWVILGFLLVTYSGMWVMSWMVQALMAGVPLDLERRIGEKELVEVRKEMRLDEDATNLVARLTSLAMPVTDVMLPREMEIQFHIVDSPDPNAFALPGGHVLVTRGMMNMVDGPEELLGVIAHELAHLKKRHAFSRILLAGGPILICQVFLGGRDGVGSVLSKGSGLLVYQTFSQDQELEADAQAWDALVKARIHPRGMIDVLHKLSRFDNWQMGPRALSSHPVTRKRIDRLEEKWKRLPQKTGFVTVTNEMWRETRFSFELDDSTD